MLEDPINTQEKTTRPPGQTALPEEAEAPPNPARVQLSRMEGYETQAAALSPRQPALQLQEEGGTTDAGVDADASSGSGYVWNLNLSDLPTLETTFGGSISEGGQALSNPHRGAPQPTGNRRIAAWSDLAVVSNELYNWMIARDSVADVGGILHTHHRDLWRSWGRVKGDFVDDWQVASRHRDGEDADGLWDSFYALSGHVDDLRELLGEVNGAVSGNTIVYEGGNDYAYADTADYDANCRAAIEAIAAEGFPALVEARYREAEYTLQEVQSGIVERSGLYVQFAAWISSAVGPDAPPERYFDDAIQARSRLRRALQQDNYSEASQFRWPQLEAQVNAINEAFTAVNNLVVLVNGYRDALQASAGAAIQALAWTSCACFSLVGGLAGGLVNGGVASVIVSTAAGGITSAASNIVQQLASGEPIDPGEVLTEAAIGALTAGIGDAASQRIGGRMARGFGVDDLGDDFVQQLSVSDMVHAPEIIRLAESTAGQQRIVGWVADRIGSAGGNLISSTLSHAAHVVGPGASWGELQDVATTNLALQLLADAGGSLVR